MADTAFQNWNVSNIKRDLLTIFDDCSLRRLTNISIWTAEILYALKDVKVAKVTTKISNEESITDSEIYMLGVCYFNNGEYQRAENILRNSSHHVTYFLYLYCKYLTGEKKLADQRPILNIGNGSENISHLKELKNELKSKQNSSQLDAYELWLYGLVLSKLKLVDEAIFVFCKAIQLKPSFWSPWEQLAKLVTDSFMLANLSVPVDHWMYSIFKAYVLSQLNLGSEATDLLLKIKKSGFSDSTFIMVQLGRTYNYMRDMENACEQFEMLSAADPYRIDDMDIYSNILYVQEKRQDLAVLANKLSAIDKYRPQTCCAIGNYYSIRGTHDKAALYFERTLKLDPNYSDACTLLGHEYLNLKHFAGAIQSYRRGLDLNQNDYRAWYGLAQVYELLHLHRYSLYYFVKAHNLRPNDFRAIIGLGVCYEALKRLEDAKQCYWKAHQIGDGEGTAVYRLAKIYETLGEQQNAALAYLEFLDFIDTQRIIPLEESLATSYKYLANFYLKQRNFKEAKIYSDKCLEIPQAREEGKQIQKQISNLIESSMGDNDIVLGNMAPSLLTATPGSQMHDSSTCKPDNSSLCFTP